MASENVETIHNVDAIDDIDNNTGFVSFESYDRYAGSFVPPQPWSHLGHTAALSPTAVEMPSCSWPPEVGSGPMCITNHGACSAWENLHNAPALGANHYPGTGLLGVNLIGDLNFVDNNYAEINANVFIQPDFGQVLPFGINPLPLSIPSHGVAVNLPNGRPACLCGTSFGRTDALQRHIRTASRRDTPGCSGQFPCLLCDNRRGSNSFSRRDHLRQHLGEKGYHKMNKEAINEYFRTHVDY